MRSYMEQKRTLTIFIPTYNRSRLLKETLDSIFSQLDDKMKDEVEIVISDDASTDNTKTVIRPYMEKHKNISYYRNGKNLRFFNTVHISDYIQSKYIVLLADDDCLTNFALSTILEIIEKKDFDILFHKPLFSEKLDVQPPQKHNTFSTFAGIQEYIKFLYEKEREYKNLICYFSFYSAVIVKRDYRIEALSHVESQSLRTNNFPHEFLHYYNLKDKTIVVPDNTLVLGRLLNEGYPGAKILIKDFKEIMEYIEKNNHLQDLEQREKIKNVCIKGRKRTILLGIWIRRLHINYKNNNFLKKIYFLYKRFFQ